MSTIKKLLFVDTNIWLDFYRTRSEAGLSLLNHLDAVADCIIVTYQLEMEFKKNRQSAILEGMQELKPPQNIQRPGIFSDAQAVKTLQNAIKAADQRVKTLKSRYTKILENPSAHDPVYKVVQRVFHKTDELVLRREDVVRHMIRKKAFRRFLLGCPPRKKNDTSIGDALNWEWIVHCAIERNAELVIVSRDCDYGIVVENTGYLNDHLRQEFSERVSKKRKIALYTKLSEALRHFKIPVTKAEEKEEERLIEERSQKEAQAESTTSTFIDELKRTIQGYSAHEDLNETPADKGIFTELTFDTEPVPDTPKPASAITEDLSPPKAVVDPKKGEPQE